MNSVLRIGMYEKIVLAVIFLLVIIGIVGSYIDTDWYDLKYAVEDGFIEWLTVVGLLLACFTAANYLITLGKKRTVVFIICMIGIVLLTFFSAGEEISWGQRIFHIKTPEYFEEHNSQDEMNIHNLVVDGEKLNKIVFTLILGICAGIYIIIVPLVYKFSAKGRQFLNYCGLPVARLYQILGIAGVGLLHLVIRSNIGKQPEVLEFGVCAIFFLIVAFPENRSIFRKNPVTHS